MILNLSHRVFLVWRRNSIVWRRYLRTAIVGMIANPLLYFVAIGYGLGSFVGDIEGIPYLQFLAPALVVSAVMNIATFETTFSSFTKMEREKIYYAIAVTPVNFEEIIAADILWGMTKGVLSGVSIYIISLFFNTAQSFWVIGVIPLLFLVGFVFAALGMIVTSFAKSYDFFSFYMSLIVQPMFLLSGTFFPLSSFPEIVQKLAWFSPLTHVVVIARGLYSGQLQADMLLHLLWTCLFGIAFALIALYRMKRRLYV